MARLIYFDNFLNLKGIVHFFGAKAAMKYVLSKKEYKELISNELFNKELESLKFSIEQKQAFVDAIFETVETLPDDEKERFFESFHDNLNKKEKSKWRSNIV